MLSVLIAVSFCASACSRALVINTVPDGARVRVNGVDKGPAPVVMTDHGGMGRTYTVEAIVPGERRMATLRQEWSGECTAFLVSGIFIWPLLFGLLGCQMVPEPAVTIELNSGSAQNPEAARR